MVPGTTSLVMEVVSGPPLDVFHGRWFTDGSDMGCQKNGSRMIDYKAFRKKILAMWVMTANFLISFCGFVS